MSFHCTVQETGLSELQNHTRGAGGAGVSQSENVRNLWKFGGNDLGSRGDLGGKEIRNIRSRSHGPDEQLGVLVLAPVSVSLVCCCAVTIPTLNPRAALDQKPLCLSKKSRIGQCVTRV